MYWPNQKAVDYGIVGGSMYNMWMLGAHGDSIWLTLLIVLASAIIAKLLMLGVGALFGKEYPG